jgi:hypothetical protein
VPFQILPCARQYRNSPESANSIDGTKGLPAEEQGRQLLLAGGALPAGGVKQAGKRDALCLIATEDETYTYNHKVNRVNRSKSTS